MEDHLGRGSGEWSRRDLGNGNNILVYLLIGHVCWAKVLKNWRSGGVGTFIRELVFDAVKIDVFLGGGALRQKFWRVKGAGGIWEI